MCNEHSVESSYLQTSPAPVQCITLGTLFGVRPRSRPERADDVATSEKEVPCMAFIGLLVVVLRYYCCTRRLRVLFQHCVCCMHCLLSFAVRGVSLLL